MVFNVTLINISAISWRSVFLMEETRVPGENNRPVASNYCRIEYTSPWTGFGLTTLVVICTDCTGRCKSNYHTITTTTAPTKERITKMVIKQLGQISRSFSSYFFLYSGNRTILVAIVLSVLRLTDSDYPILVSTNSSYNWYSLSFLWYKTVLGYVTASLSAGSENEICVIK